MGSAALALRSAGAASRTQTFSAVRWAQRPSLLKSRIAVQPWGSNLRNASSESTTSAATEAVKVAPKKAPGGLKKAAIGTSLALVLLAGVVYVTDTRASFHRYVSVPLVRILYPDAEDAHHLAVDGLKTLYKFGLNPRERGDQDGDCLLVTEVNTHVLALIKCFSTQYKQFMSFPLFRSSDKLSRTQSELLPDLTKMLKSPTRCSKLVLQSSKSEV